MTHRAETTMQAVLTNITGLATTGNNVSRGRGQPVATVPALTLQQAPDELVEGITNMGFVDRVLSFRVIAHVKTSGQFDTDLNAIREEVYVALMADRNQGLPAFVIDTMPLGDDEPELSSDAEKDIGRQAMNFAIQYRHSVTNPGA